MGMYKKELDVNANILIVGDDDISRRMLGRILKEGEYIFKEASGAAEARKLLEERQFELILCDIGLPGESGLDFIRFALSRYPHMAAVMVTGLNDLKTAKESIGIGVYDYITKPLEPNRILFSVANALRRREIERHKHTNEDLIKSELKYSLLLYNIPGFVYKGYKDWSVDFNDNKVEELTGYDKEEFDSRKLKWSDLMFNEDLKASKAAILQALNTDDTYLREYRIKTKTGGILWAQDRGQIVRNEKDEIDYFNGVFFDITKQKQAEEKYQLLVNNASDAIIIAQDDKIKFSNPKAEEISGYSGEELASIPLFDFIHPADRDIVVERFKKKFSGDKITDTISFRIQNKTGQEVWVQPNTTLIAWEGRPAALSFLRDISKLKQAENEREQIETQLLQSEKMASIGQLAAGVAHEINNPTGFVSSNLKTLSDYTKDINGLIKEYRKITAELKENASADADYAAISAQLIRITTLEDEVDIDFILNDILELIEESREGSERIKKIVQDLKDFAHPGEDKLKFADINKNLDSTVNVVGNELKYKAEVTKDYGDLPEVQCYPQLLNQVFVNILVNAAQSIKERGKIGIKTRADNGYVEIKISDTGSGIPKENLAKIFDPFFTTKEVGKGTGLGMNVVYNIIKKHNGLIDVESKVGQGTTFIIRLAANTELV